MSISSQIRQSSPTQSGGGEIRTLETLSSLPPFQGGALDRYATPPLYVGLYFVITEKDF